MGTRRHHQLVKLRGSADAPELAIGAPAVDVAESVWLGRARLTVLTSAVDADGLMITGYSGNDLDCVEPLLASLRNGRFSWVSQHIGTELAARLKMIDPGQPIRGDAVGALRRLLGQRQCHIPPWPAITLHEPGYEHRFELWRRRLPDAVAAEAGAWMLSDAGHDGPAVELLELLAHQHNSARRWIRLADARRRRNNRGDPEYAATEYRRNATHPGTPTPVAAYALARHASVDTAADTIACLRTLIKWTNFGVSN